MKKTVIEIPLKLPSLNEYTRANRSNQYIGARMKKITEYEICFFINRLPKFEKPIRITFIWVEKDKRRDYDNIAFAKKFILDALQKCGKLENDNRKWVTGFTDKFELGKDYKVILEIEEE